MALFGVGVESIGGKIVTLPHTVWWRNARPPWWQGANLKSGANHVKPLMFVNRKISLLWHDCINCNNLQKLYVCRIVLICKIFAYDWVIKSDW